MIDRNQENLKELFEKFLSAEESTKAVEDVQKAEQILRENPTPEPDDMLIANIKAEIAMRLPLRRADVFRRMAYKVATVAAAIIIVAAISVSLLEEKDTGPEKLVYASIIPRAIWESDNIATDDAELAVLTVELEQIEAEVSALQLGENGTNGDRAVEELQMELIEINSAFWKG